MFSQQICSLERKTARNSELSYKTEVSSTMRVLAERSMIGTYLYS